ncbi:MAG TPA: redoxin domain-containing protein [Flavisolibacter sp.]|nr:redoxin domain-containing protein [Flavisolibacter sp.]
MKILLTACLLVLSTTLFAQPDTTTPIYKRFPTLPPLQLFLPDSLTKYTKEDIPKKKPVLIMLFSPDCEHCKHEAEELAAQKESFKNIHIIMVSPYPFYRLREFADTYGLSGLQNVVIAKDPSYFLMTFYNIRNFPYMALYNKKGQLIETIEGSKPMETVLLSFKNNK